MKQSYPKITFIALIGLLFVPTVEAMRGKEFRPVQIIEENKGRNIKPQLSPIQPGTYEHIDVLIKYEKNKKPSEIFEEYLAEFSKEYKISPRVTNIVHSIGTPNVLKALKLINACKEEEIFQLLQFLDFLLTNRSVLAFFMSIIKKQLSGITEKQILEHKGLLSFMPGNTFKHLDLELLFDLLKRAQLQHEKITLSPESIKLFTGFPEQMKFDFRRAGTVDISATSKSTEIMFRLIKKLSKTTVVVDLLKLIKELIDLAIDAKKYSASLLDPIFPSINTQTDVLKASIIEVLMEECILVGVCYGLEFVNLTLLRKYALKPELSLKSIWENAKNLSLRSFYAAAIIAEHYPKKDRLVILLERFILSCINHLSLLFFNGLFQDLITQCKKIQEEFKD